MLGLGRRRGEMVGGGVKRAGGEGHGDEGWEGNGRGGGGGWEGAVRVRKG